MAVDEGMQAIQSEVVQQWIAAFNAHNVPAIVSLYMEEAVLYDTGMKYARKGKSQIERWFAERFRAMPTITYSPGSRLFGENQAVVMWTARGSTPRLLGLSWLARPFQVEGVSHFLLHEGRILRQHGYYDHLSVLEQALPPLKWLLPFRL